MPGSILVSFSFFLIKQKKKIFRIIYELLPYPDLSLHMGQLFAVCEIFVWISVTIQSFLSNTGHYIIRAEEHLECSCPFTVFIILCVPRFITGFI